MLDILLDALIDTLKTLPFLFGAYLLIEFLEHRASEKLTGALRRLGPFGPVGGAVLGLVPQCGFSVAAANFYAGRLITPGTLVAVFLATSDEALPILVSQPGALPDLLLLLGVKLVSGAVFGVLTDLIWKRLPHRTPEHPFEELCKDCDCEHHGIFRAALTHTVRIALFLLLVNLVLGGAIHFVGEERISQVLLSGSVLQPFVAALIGFIPQLRLLRHPDGAVPLRLPVLWGGGGWAVHRGRGGPGGAVQVQPPPEGKPAAGGHFVRVRCGHGPGVRAAVLRAEHGLCGTPRGGHPSPLFGSMGRQGLRVSAAASGAVCQWQTPSTDRSGNVDRS